MYKKSAKKWKELLSVGEAIEMRVLKPVRAQGTRWIDHRRKALIAFDRDYQAMVLQFEEVASGERKDIPPADAAKMKGYLKMLKSHEFVLHMAFYQDLVDDLAAISTSLQADNLALSSIRGNIEACTLELLGKRGTDATGVMGPRIKIVVQDVTEESNWQFRGHKLKTSDNTIAVFQRNSLRVLNLIITSIEERFQNFTEDEIIVAADIMEPANIPIERAILATYGNNEVELLTNHFKDIMIENGCCLDDIPREWKKLKLDLASHHQNQPLQTVWQHVLRDKSDKYPNVLHIIRILLVCPVATAQVERQFSYIKRFLGDWRLSLKLATLEDLLRICTEGPAPEEFDPEPAVQRWWAEKTRRCRHRKPHRTAPGPTDGSNHGSDSSDSSDLEETEI